MSNLLKEILDMQPEPFTWLDDNRATFEFEGHKFGVHADFQRLQLAARAKDRIVCNISFGVIKGPSFKSGDDLDTQLTELGKPRVVFSTVGAACINNPQIVDSDVICLAGADTAKRKRSVLYSVALAEIRHKVPEFKLAYDIQVHTANGTIISLLSKEQFTHAEQIEIADKLGISK